MSTGTMDGTSGLHAAGETIRFGQFRLHPARRVLVEDDRAVHLGNRALDILLLLVERAGEFVTNDEIFARVWPRTVVVEQNLRVHIAALRKALGDGRDGARYIVNVPNRGYQFTPEVRREVGRLAVPSEEPLSVKGALPAPLHRIIGRELVIESLSEQVQRRRLVTIVGAGGIGKTTVAVSVASRFKVRASGSPWNSIHFVDLAPLADPQLVPNVLAASLSLVVGEDPISNLIAYLHDKSALIVLDTCEHLVTAVAATVEEVLRRAPRVHILATSREPLRAEGEWIQRLLALDLPGGASHATLKEAMEFGAVELFVERASASLSGFEFNDADIPHVVEICRRLDGIPLAIELAAARVDSLGVKGVAAALLDSIALLSKGRRTALPRQQTLEATLDWSYRLLSPTEQAVLARLSMFAGSFSLEAATEIAASNDPTASSVLDAVADLVSKSLIAADVTGEDARFRLPDTMRAYAAAKLAQSPDASPMRRRHAEHCLSFLKAGEREWTTMPATAWVKRYGYRVDDVRAALNWCFSPAGDIHLGVAMTAKAAPLLFQASFASEELILTRRALDALAVLDLPDLQSEFDLNVVYGLLLVHTQGLQPESEQALARALEIARETGDCNQLALAVSSNWLGAYFRDEPALMQELAAKFSELTQSSTDPAIQLLHGRMQSATLHFSGDQKAARICSESGLAKKTHWRSPFLGGAMLDRRVAIGNVLTRTLWLLGLPLQANRVALETMDVAVREGESVALAAALCFAACPLAIWSGWKQVARQRLVLALRHTAEHSLLGWRRFALAYEALLDWSNAGAVGSLALPEAVVRTGWPPHLGELLATMNPLCAMEATLERGDSGKAGWCEAELLRLRGERALAADPAQAEAFFLRSLQIATKAETLAWEMRASVSIGRLWGRTGRPREAYEQLESVLTRVQEGFSTPDFRSAVSLYQSLAASIGAYARHFPDADDAVVLAFPDSFAGQV